MHLSSEENLPPGSNISVTLEDTTPLQISRRPRCSTEGRIAPVTKRTFHPDVNVLRRNRSWSCTDRPFNTYQEDTGEPHYASTIKYPSSMKDRRGSRSTLHIPLPPSLSRFKSGLTRAGRGQNEEERLDTYVDLHHAMTSVMYLPSVRKKKSPIAAKTVESGRKCVMLGFALFIGGLIALDWFVFWKPQGDEVDQGLKDTREKLVNPTIVVLILFSRALRMFDESHKHGIKRLILFLLLPCKIFVALSGLENEELRNQFRWSLLTCGLLAIQFLLYGAMVAGVVKVGLVERHSSWALWMNMIVMATAVTGYPFAEDVSHSCFTTMIFLDLPQKFNGLLLVGIFLFVKYAGMLSVRTVAWNFATNLNVVAMILGICVSVSGLEIAFEDDDINHAYSILSQALVALANCLRPLSMVFIGLSLNTVGLESLAQVACVFLRRSSWILVGLYYRLAPPDTDRASLLALLLFANSSSSIHVFLHMENIAKALEQKDETVKDDNGSTTNLERYQMSFKLEQVNDAIECIMPLICYDFGVTVFLNILISMHKDWFTNGTNVMLCGGLFTLIGAGFIALGVYLGGNKLRGSLFEINVISPLDRETFSQEVEITFPRTSDVTTASAKFL